MPRKPKITNAREFVKTTLTLIEGLNQYGYAPVLIDLANQLSFIGSAILRQADAKRKAGDRKDLYITR